MKKLFLVSSLLSVSAFAADFKGVISEEHCGLKHAEASEAAKKCVTGCIKKGAAPVLVSEGKIYKLSDASKVTADMYGQNVVVKGTADGDTITVTSITAAQSN
ncbi:MAG TPA: hypothetical protein VFL57_16290 [Bryobacteraceae bacterium]|nr:hypothetical protein [Bryobacteraceae bacterium]